MKLQKYNAKAIETLFSVMDGYVTISYEVILIGGAAATLAYHIPLQTQDIDTYNIITPLEEAYKLAVQKTGLKIPFERSPVFDSPYNFEDRLVDISKNLALKNLRVKVPERHALVLMKMIRGSDHDFYAIEEIHKQHPLDKATLTQRFMNEMDQVIGRPKDLQLKFLTMISLLYGDEAADDLSKKLESASHHR